MKASIVAILLLVLLLVASAALVESMPQIKNPVEFIVDSTLDEIDADPDDDLCQTAAGTCTLRAAVMQANTISEPGVKITLPAGVYMFTRPSQPGLHPQGGDLDFLSPTIGSPVIQIFGAEDAPTIIDANGLDRVLQVHPSRHVILSDLTLQHGFLDPELGDTGAGVRNEGELELLRSTIYENVAKVGGGVDNTGTLLLESSTISDNVAIQSGGGIANQANCTGLEPTTYVLKSTLTNNFADLGGAVFNCAGLFITNSTLTQNHAESDGGAIYNLGVTNVYNSTIVYNQADADKDNEGGGGGTFNHPDVSGLFNLRNTLVAGNYFADPSNYNECSGDLTSFGRNLIGVGDAAAGCDIFVSFGTWHSFNSLKELAPLSDNGGPTFTHALLPGSNAIDSGDPQFGCVDQHSQPLPVDQRDQPRVVDGNHTGEARCDIGAFEFSILPTPTATPSPNATAPPSSTATPSPTSTLTPSATPTTTQVPGDPLKVYLPVLLRL